MNAALAAFSIVFLAELGDKTQLVAFGLAARHSPAPVAAGVITAYLLTTTISVAIGGVIGNFTSSTILSRATGVLFLGFAVAALLRSEPDDQNPTNEESGPQSTIRVFTSVAVMMTIAEIGDKTMLATAALAAKGDAATVWVGAASGIVAAGLGAVVAGHLFGAQVPERLLRFLSAGLFAAFGVASLVW